MKKVLFFATVGEAATGVALLIMPSLVGRLLLGAELAGVSIPVARVAGIALIALGLACRPVSDATPGLLAMLIYGLLVTLYLAWLGMSGKWVGSLLWPAVVVHAILTMLLVRVWLNNQRSRGKT
jgi:hypothetical protein